MSKYIITYDCGYGAQHEILEIGDQDHADARAWEIWLHAAEEHGSYQAEEYTPELAAEYGITIAAAPDQVSDIMQRNATAITILQSRNDKVKRRTTP